MPTHEGADSERDALEVIALLGRRLGSSLELTATLDAVAQAVVDTLGFGAAVVNTVVDDGALEVAVVAGPEPLRAQLLGSREPRQSWDLMLAACEPWGRLRFLDHRLAGPAADAVPGWVPDLPVSDDPLLWHPLDSLFAPLHASDGRLLGVLSVDLPPDNRKPGPAVRRLLEAFALLAGLAIEHAVVYGLLRRSEVRFRAVVEGSPVAVALLDAQRQLVDVNDALCRLLGRPRSELLGHRPAEFTVEEDLALRAVDGAPVEKRYHRPDGTVVWGRLSVTTLDPEGAALDQPGQAHIVAYIEDITDARLLETRLRHDALTDPLTGLANRARLQARLAELTSAQDLERRRQRPLAVLYCDLDHFKLVNDNHGHAVGDVLLEVLGRRLRATLRASDVVARVGGDEFVVVAERLSTAAEGTRLAERLIAAVAHRVRVGDVVVEPSVSIGVALSAPGDTPKMLLHRADTALYAAKAAGRACWRLASAPDAPDAPGADR